MSAEQSSSSSSAPSDSSKDVESKTSSKPLTESKIPTNNGSNKPKQQSSNNNNKQIRKVRYSFQKRPFVIGVAGGTASGKSTVCSKIMEKLGPIDPTSVYLSHEKRVICISQDSFYRKMTDSDRTMVAKGNFNFDHPAAFDVPRLVQTLRDVLNGKMVKVPIYNYIENEISDQEETIYPADVILVEGLLLFYFPEVRDMFHMKIFVDTDPDTRLARRVMRDVKERNRDLNTCLTLYTKFVKPSFEEFCLPTKKYADIIVPRGPDNEVAVDLIVTHTRSIIDPSIRHRSIDYGQYGLMMNGGGNGFGGVRDVNNKPNHNVRNVRNSASKCRLNISHAPTITTTSSNEDLRSLNNRSPLLMREEEQPPCYLINLHNNNINTNLNNGHSTMNIESDDDDDDDVIFDDNTDDTYDIDDYNFQEHKEQNGQSNGSTTPNQLQSSLYKLSILTKSPTPTSTSTSKQQDLPIANGIDKSKNTQKISNGIPYRKNGIIHNKHDIVIVDTSGDGDSGATFAASAADIERSKVVNQSSQSLQNGHNKMAYKSLKSLESPSAGGHLLSNSIKTTNLASVLPNGDLTITGNNNSSTVGAASGKPATSPKVRPVLVASR